MFNLLYKYAYWLYEPIYIGYKKWSDREKIKLLKSLLKKGDTVLDIGANIGFYTRLFSDLVGPSGKVYAFEPDNKNFDHLKKNLQKRSNVILEKKAVGEMTCTKKFYHSEDLNVDHQSYDSGEGRSYTEVEQVHLDEYFTNDIIINFIKIDIQGYDYFAIKGMQKLLRYQSDITMLGELWPYGLLKAKSSFQEYLKLLKDSGFNLYSFQALSSSELVKKQSDLEYYTDLLAVKKQSDLKVSDNVDTKLFSFSKF